MKKLLKNKKGYFFSLDAFIALLIILGVVIFIRPSSQQISNDESIQEDLVVVLSSLSIGEIDNSYVQDLITQGKITNFNQSVLEQIGEFYANSDEDGRILAQNILDELNLEQNVAIYFNNIPIATTGDLNFADSENVFTSRQIISGIQEGNSSKGYSSRAFLSSENKVDYFYFGGYVGDGNLSVYLGKDVVSIKIEADFSGAFNLSINGNTPTNYNPIPGTPFILNLNSGFLTGDNSLEFTSSNNLYIAGGYIKIVYNNSEFVETENKKYFPGIEGFINLYDSFYIPGTLNTMQIFLNYSSLYDIFLTIGNTSVYEGNGSSVQTTITNSELSSLFDYNDLSNKTIPFRLGIRDVSYLINLKRSADVYSVTDLSGSMVGSCNGGGGWCCLFNHFCRAEEECNYCGGVWEDKLQSAKDANYVFIDAVLNDSDNRVGLVGYSYEVYPGNTHVLSNDSDSLKAEVSEWTAGGGTCICCGINEGVNRIISESNEEKFRSLVIMSDGVPTETCDEQGTGNPSQDAIQAACDAAAQGIKVYAVAFGSDANRTTLESIASCGEGSFYYGDLEDLIAIYEDIAQEILDASYYEQTIIGEGFHTSLYPSSYISLNYDAEIPYGLIITAETNEFGNSFSQGSFNVTNDTIPYDVRVVSYSGSLWTSNVEVYDNSSSTWESIFNLNTYDEDYIDLGDPYVVNIPLDKIHYGENLVRVSNAVGATNSTWGSEHNKIIYSLIKEISSYSQIVASAQGCTWVIDFEDGTNSTMSFPSSYAGTETCYYTFSNIAYNNNDAIDNAVYNLLVNLDLNSNGMIETKFSENDLTINSIEIDGIPFTWETEVQVRVWD